MVAVRLTGDQITVPQEVVSGSTTFRVYNGGTAEHGFAIEGEGAEAKLPRPLHPGESLTLEADLNPGTYRLYCPLDDHVDETLEVEVVEAR